MRRLVNILTWVDSDHDGVVDSGEQMAFSTANEPTLRPYLRATSSTEGTKIINFVRGCDATTCIEQAATRDRRLQVPPGSSTLKVWKLGDVIHSTPTVVAGPKDRHDAIYGDQSYAAFLQKWYNRRQVAYVGATTACCMRSTPGITIPVTTRAPLPCQHYRARLVHHGSCRQLHGCAIREELWGFVPYELLPQLEFLSRADYQHTYYVDLPLG